MIAYVEEHGVVPLTDLEAHFGISMSTLRRDITTLCEKGALKKMYGCVSKNTASESVVPFHLRSGIQQEKKMLAAKAAAQFVKDQDFIFIDSGSTTCLLVDFLQERKQVSIVTNNLDVVIRAIPYPNLQVYMLPGLLNRENNSFNTLSAQHLFESYNITKVFMACSGFSLQSGVSHSALSEGMLKQQALTLSNQRYLILDDTKFGTAAPLRLCGADEFTCICTSSTPPEDYVQYFRAHEIGLAVGDQ